MNDGEKVNIWLCGQIGGWRALEELKFRMRWAESSKVQDEVGSHVSVESCTMNLNECVHLKCGCSKEHEKWANSLGIMD